MQKSLNILGPEIPIKSSMAVSRLFPGHRLNMQQPLRKFIVGDVQAQIQKSLNILGPEIPIKSSMAVSRLFPGHSLNIQQSLQKLIVGDVQAQIKKPQHSRP